MNTNCAWRNCECIYSQYKWGGAGADPTRARGGAHPGQVASLLQSQHRETNVQAPFHTDLYCLVLILIGCNGTQWSNGFGQIICTNLGEHWEKFNLVIALFTQRDDIARHYRKKKNNCLQHNIFTVTKQRELLNISRLLEAKCWKFFARFLKMSSLTEFGFDRSKHWRPLLLPDGFCCWLWLAVTDKHFGIQKNQHDNFWRLKTGYLIQKLNA